jgi:hypothetical protein
MTPEFAEQIHRALEHTGARRDVLAIVGPHLEVAEMTPEFAEKLYLALVYADVGSRLLAIIGSRIAAASEEETLKALTAWNDEMDRRKGQ